MQKIVSGMFAMLALLGSMVNASQFENSQQITQITPKLVYQGTHGDRVLDAVFSSDGSRLLSFDHSGEAKLWDLTSFTLLDSRQHRNMRDAAWFNDTHSFVIISDSMANFYTGKFELLGKFEADRNNDFQHLASFPEQQLLVLSSRNSFQLVDSTGKKHKEAELSYNVNGRKPLVSPDEKNILLVRPDAAAHQHHVYSATSLELIRKAELLQSTRWGNNLPLFTGRHVWTVSNSGMKQTNLDTGVSQELQLDKWPDNADNLTFIHGDNSYLLYSSNNHRDRLLYQAFDRSRGFAPLGQAAINFASFNKLIYNEASRMLIAIRGNNLFVYDMSALYSTPTAVIAAPVPVDTATDEPVQQVITPAPRNMDIQVQASISAGVAPLEVSFILDSSAPELVEATYSKIGNKEKIHDGIPLQISHTFTTAGKHTAMFAFRSVDGEVVKQQLVIDVREESFEDFKQRVMGN